MKTILFVLMACMMALPSFAQNENEDDSYVPDPYRKKNTIIAFGPGVWKPTLKFEQGVSDYVTLGFHLTGRFIMWRGGKVEPFVRVYFAGEAPRGGFIQVKGIAGTYQRIFRWTYDTYCDYDAQGNYVCYDDYSSATGERFFSFGGGIVGGYQALWGRNRNFAFDVFGGFQYAYNRDELDPYVFWRRFMLNFPVEVGLRFGVAF